MQTSSPWKLFVFSSIGSCTAELCTVPIDVIKVRLQLSGEGGTERAYTGMFDAGRKILRNEGIQGLYKGTTPALLRQATYGGMRVGMYEPIKGICRGIFGNDGVAVKLASGMTSGAIAAATCAPTDRIKVMLQAEKGREKGRNIPWAFRRILDNEGWRGLYRGAGPTAGRAAVLAAVELATYDEAKSAIIRFGQRHNIDFLAPKSIATHAGASLLAGFFATITTTPIDTVRSRLMAHTGSTPRYTGALDAASSLVRNEGVLALWKGVVPTYVRIGPHVTVMFLVIEQLRNFFD